MTREHSIDKVYRNLTPVSKFSQEGSKALSFACPPELQHRRELLSFRRAKKNTDDSLSGFAIPELGNPMGGVLIILTH
jgi:hypothetical protein